MPAGAQEVSGATSAPGTADPGGSLKDSLCDMVPCRADLSLNCKFALPLSAKQCAKPQLSFAHFFLVKNQWTE